MSRELCAEDGAFKKVPAEVYAHCLPQASGQYVDGGDENARCNHNRYDTNQSCIWGHQMDHTEENGANHESDP